MLVQTIVHSILEFIQLTMQEQETRQATLEYSIQENSLELDLMERMQDYLQDHNTQVTMHVRNIVDQDQDHNMAVHNITISSPEYTQHNILERLQVNMKDSSQELLLVNIQ